jgi:ribosomal protein S18 acetylase RimI-like enzyme
MAVFVPDLSDVRRAQAIVVGYSRSRQSVIAALPGNPRGAECRTFEGGGVVLRTPGAPGNVAFNRACGFHDGLIEHVPGVIAWFAEGAGGVFELVPGEPITKIARMLAEAGYAQSGFHATMVGPVGLPDAPARGVEVERLTDPAELADFSGAYHAGWEAPAGRIPIEYWLELPGWSLYTARVEGRPAGAAVLYTVGEDGYLADGAVDPAFRRLGVHRALIDRRCADAAVAGARRIFGGCDYLSGSFRNQLRKGLSLLYTEALWASGPAGERAA